MIDGGVYAVGKAFLFPDIFHEPGSEEATQNVIDENCGKMLPCCVVLGKQGTQSNRCLNTVFTAQRQ